LAALLAVGLWIASGIAVPEALSPYTGRLQGFVTIFLGIFIEALPFLMAGVLASSAIHLFVTPERIRDLSPKNPVLAALAGSLLGMVFPVCECGSIPTTRRLMAKGAPLTTGIAFALAAPVINPIVLVSTFVAFGTWSIVAWRMGLTIIIAVIVGVLVGMAPRRDMILAPAALGLEDLDADQPRYTPDPVEQRGFFGPARLVLAHANTELFEMLRYLIAGALLAAGLQTLVPQPALNALGSGPVLSVVVMIVLAAVLSICSTVDSFIALSFVNTFTPGAVMAFLVFGPMIDIKSTLLLTTTFNRRTVAIIVLLCFQLALLAGVLMNVFLL
jgi:uncharacterized membrane protein YraQ (UPF0718 family)